jgi:tryptophan synthase alpha chain
MLVAPTTPPKRAEEILKNAEGFVYYIMVKGVTGSRERVAADLEIRVSNLRKITSLPIVAGFGIGNTDQARKIARCADGIVIGSALIEAARKKRLGSFVRELRQALSPGER